MKILSREEFLKMPPNTLYSTFKPCYLGDMEIKMESMESDFFAQRIHDAIDCDNSEEFTEKLMRANKTGESLEMDLDSYGRDGAFGFDDRYAVWERKDVEELIERLKRCLH